jgi:type II secretory pathway pseudopilin PulG
VNAVNLKGDLTMIETLALIALIAILAAFTCYASARLTQR